MTNEPSVDPHPDANRDPITGEPGSHPVGTGLGAAGGGAAGAAIGGAVGGPIGAVVGAVVGAVSGGAAGKGVAENLDPTVEDAYWRDNYSSREYARGGEHTYEDYQPAYKLGYGRYSAAAAAGRTYQDEETNLKADWEKVKGNSRLGWEKAKHATKDAWHRVERAVPGDADGDGR